MADLDILVGRFAKQGNGTSIPARMTAQQSMATALVEPFFMEAARAGRRFGGGNQIIANGIANVTAIPTTTAALALYNGESDGGRSYLIDSIVFWLGSGTAAAGAVLMGALSGAKIASAVAMATGYSTGSLSSGGLTTKATLGTAVTLTGSPVWIGLIPSLQLAAANVGQGVAADRELFGGILVKPGFAFGMSILTGNGTSPLYGISLTWTEFEADVE